MAKKSNDRGDWIKNELLSLSTIIASEQDYKQLLKIIYEKIKPLFPYDNAGLFVFDERGEHIYEIVDSDVISDEIQTKLTNKNLLGPFVYKDWNKGCWMNSKFPVIDTLANQREIAAEFDSAEQYDIGIQMGLQQMIGGPLVCRGKVIGMLCFNSKKENFYKEDDFGIFRFISEMIAVAIHNIITTEKLAKKAKEIETLNTRLQAQNEYLVDEIEELYNFNEIIGQEEIFLKICQNISLVSKTDTTVLLLGETGTGKELVARAIHNHSTRKLKPLVKINCAALPANLIESELFGHERGAFTGAIEKRIGKFEIANGSTLFLDEIGELPLDLQAKLLRALQEREIERLGSNKVINLDVRIIAATNRNLSEEVTAGKFRKDLFYRLNIFPIELPALRERKEDIPLLAIHFLSKYAKKAGKKIQGFSNKAMQEMMLYNWPGNIRELEHFIERSVILCTNRVVQEMNLPQHHQNKTLRPSVDLSIKTWDEQQRDYILEILKITKGNVTGKGGAAEVLNLKPSTLQAKMLKLGIKRKHYAE